MQITGCRNPQLTLDEWNSLPIELRVQMMRNKYTFEFDERRQGPHDSSLRFKMKACRRQIYKEIINRLLACDGMYYVAEREKDAGEGYNVVDYFFENSEDVQHIAGFMSVSFDPTNYKETIENIR